MLNQILGACHDGIFTSRVLAQLRHPNRYYTGFDPPDTCQIKIMIWRLVYWRCLDERRASEVPSNDSGSKVHFETKQEQILGPMEY